MSFPNHATLNANIAGATTAFFLLVGRWSPERLLGIESERQFSLNFSVFQEPRLWALPVLLSTVLLLKIPRLRRGGKQDQTILRYRKLAFLSLVMLMLYFIGSSAWTPDLRLGTYKAYETFLTLGVILAVALWHLSTDAELFHRAFWKSLVYLTGIIAVFALISLGSGRLAALGGGPNVFARLMFLFGAGCMGMSKQHHPLKLMLVLIAAGLIVLSGSRGGMLAALLGGSVYLWSERTKVTSKFLLVTGGLLIGVFLLCFTPLGNQVYETFSYRIIELTFQDGYTSGRDKLAEEAIRIWKDYPVFGAGISGWTALMIEDNAINISHPHNIFCELLCEGGIVAVLLLLLTTGCFLRNALTPSNQLHVPSLACAVMFLSASQFSGDFFDSRGIFICAMLASFPCSSIRQPSVARMAKRTLNHRHKTALVLNSRPAMTSNPSLVNHCHHNKR